MHLFKITEQIDDRISQTAKIERPRLPTSNLDLPEFSRIAARQNSYVERFLKASL